MLATANQREFMLRQEEKELEMLRQQAETINLMLLQCDKSIVERQAIYDAKRLAVEKNTESHENELQRLEECLNSKENHLNALEREIENTENNIASMEQAIEESEFQLKERVKMIMEYEKEISSNEEILKELEQQISQDEIEKRRLENLQRIQEEKRRKQIRNEAIEKKGLIRAFCRIRPSASQLMNKGQLQQIASEEKEQEKSILKIEQGSDTVYLADPKGYSASSYLFDRVFGPESLQEEIFEEVSELVDCALDGDPVCIMAYGQTGAGKSHTMKGSIQSPGLIPRAASKLFEEIHGVRAQDGWKIRVKVSAFEFYKNEVYDILVPGSRLRRCIASAGNSQLDVLARTRQEVFNAQEILECFDQAFSNRSTGSTMLNLTSSRSHFVFQIEMYAVRGDEESRGRLILVDLAGSEPKEASKDQGQAAEGAFIRTSLTALKTLLLNCSKGMKIFGDHTQKLVQFMKGVVQRNAKFLVIVNVSGEAANRTQTKDSMDFLAKISKINVDKEPGKSTGMKMFIQKKREDIRNSKQH